MCGGVLSVLKFKRRSSGLDYDKIKNGIIVIKNIFKGVNYVY